PERSVKPEKSPSSQDPGRASVGLLSTTHAHTPPHPHTHTNTHPGVLDTYPPHTHTRTIIDPSQRATKTPVITGITHIFIHSFITHTHTTYTHWSVTFIKSPLQRIMI